MFIFWFVGVYVVIIIGAVFSHFFLPVILEEYSQNVEKYTLFWETVKRRCENTLNFRLKKNEIKKLNKPELLAAFYEVFSNSSKETFVQLIKNNKSQLITLGKKFRSTTMKAYFAHILNSFEIEDKELMSQFDELMVEFTLENSVYSRENALKFLYGYGDAQQIRKVFYELSRRGIYHSEKLLSDGMLSFSGNADDFSDLIMESFDDLMQCYQVAIINYLAYVGEHRFDKELVKYIEKTSCTSDVKCAVLRCIGKIINEENKQILIRELKQYDAQEGWEVAAVAAKLLGDYMEDEDAMRALECSIRSRNWYVRMNSAQSLAKMEVSDDRVQSILDSEDEYAKNALVYSLGLS